MDQSGPWKVYSSLIILPSAPTSTLHANLLNAIYMHTTWQGYTWLSDPGGPFDNIALRGLAHGETHIEASLSCQLPHHVCAQASRNEAAFLEAVVHGQDIYHLVTPVCGQLTSLLAFKGHENVSLYLLHIWHAPQLA